MGKLEDYLLEEHNGAFLIDEEQKESKTKDEYISNAQVGLIVAFRLNFEARSGTKLTKVISGKILENNSEKQLYLVETRNGLKYGVPYASVIWLKTGSRWPKGVYEEMKQGSVEVEDQDDSSFGELEESSFTYEK